MSLCRRITMSDRGLSWIHFPEHFSIHGKWMEPFEDEPSPCQRHESASNRCLGRSFGGESDLFNWQGSAVRQLCSTARQSRSCAGFVLAVRDSFLQGKGRSSTATVSSTRIASSLGNISLQVGTTPSSPRVSIARLIGGLPIYKLWMAAMDGALVLSQMEPALSFTNPLLGMLLR